MRVTLRIENGLIWICGYVVVYRVTGQDAIQETDKWAEWAALASAARCCQEVIRCFLVVARCVLEIW